MATNEELPKAKLTRLTIKNFKGVGNSPVSLPIKPITLLFGQNSAGKSTMIEALLYARDVFLWRDANPQNARLREMLPNLGKFTDLIHMHEVGRTMQFHFEAEIPSVDRLFEDDTSPKISAEGAKILREAFVSHFGSSPIKIGVGFAIKVYGDSLEVGFPDVFVGGKKFIQWDSYNGPEDLLARFVDDEAVVALLARLGPELSTALLGRSRFCTIHASKFQAKHPRDVLFGTYDGEDNHTEDSADESYDDILKGLVGSLFFAPLLIIRSLLNDVRFTGPIRELPPRTPPVITATDNLKWSSGEAAWSCLVDPRFNIRRVHIDGSMAGFIRTTKKDYGFDEDGFIHRDSFGSVFSVDALRASVNGIFDHLRIPYHVESRCWKKLNVPADEELRLEEHRFNTEFPGPTMAEQRARLLEDKDAEYPTEEQRAADERQADRERRWKDRAEKKWDDTIRDGLASLGKQALNRDLVLVDQRSGAEVHPCDVGSGISQILPILVGCLVPPFSIYAVQQPELHLHPKLQGDLADLFLLVRREEPNRRLMLETHSEHLILRFLRRIRECGGLATPDSLLSVSPDDVAVIYVDQEASGIVLTELPIDSEGEFTRPWPHGFFEERAEDLF